MRVSSDARRDRIARANASPHSDLNYLDISGTENDLFHLARTAVEKGHPIPQMLQHCGVDDHLYESNQKFRQFAEELGLPLHYEEMPGGHDWDYVDVAIQRVLEWLPIPQPSNQEK